MTFTTVLNSTLLTLGPIVVVYHALDMTAKGGWSTACQSAGINVLCQALKLISMALLAPVLFLISGNEDRELQWTSILLNSILGAAIDGYAIFRVVGDKKLMTHTPRKSHKIMAVAIGWALAEVTAMRLVKILATEFMEDAFRVEALVSSFTGLFDFIKIIGIAFLVEKVARRGSQYSESHAIIYASIFLLTLVSEYSNYQLSS